MQRKVTKLSIHIRDIIDKFVYTIIGLDQSERCSVIFT